MKPESGACRLRYRVVAGPELVNEWTIPGGRQPTFLGRP